METKDQSKIASWINVVAGGWLILAPYIFNYVNETARTNDMWLGIVIGIVALTRAVTPINSAWLSMVNVIAGGWLIMAPFVLGYVNTLPIWNDVLLGIIVAGIAIWNMSSGGMSATRQRVSM